MAENNGSRVGFKQPDPKVVAALAERGAVGLLRGLAREGAAYAPEEPASGEGEAAPPLEELQTPAPSPAPGEAPPAPSSGEGVSLPYGGDKLGPLRTELGDDYQIPFEQTVAGWSAGAEGYNTSKLRDDLFTKRINSTFKDYAEVHGRLPSGEEFDSISKQLFEETARDIQRWTEHIRGLQRARGPDGTQASLMIDHDPSGRNLALRGWVRGADAPGDNWMAAGLNYVPTPARRYLAPVFANAMGTTSIVTDPNAPVGEESTYNDGQDILSVVDRTFRTVGPWTYLAQAARAGGAGLQDPEANPEGLTQEGFNAFLSANPLNPAFWAAVGRGYGTDEMLVLGQRGEDQFTLSDEFQLQYAVPGLWATGEALEWAGNQAGYNAKGTGESIAQGGAAFVVSLLEPDLVTLGMGAGAKGLIKASKPLARATGVHASQRAAARSAAMYQAQSRLMEGLAETLTDKEMDDLAYDIIQELKPRLSRGEQAAFDNLLVVNMAGAQRLDAAVLEEADAAHGALVAARQVFEKRVGVGPDVFRVPEFDEQIAKQAKRVEKANEAVQKAEAKVKEWENKPPTKAMQAAINKLADAQEQLKAQRILLDEAVRRVDTLKGKKDKKPVRDLKRAEKALTTRQTAFDEAGGRLAQRQAKVDELNAKRSSAVDARRAKVGVAEETAEQAAIRLLDQQLMQHRIESAAHLAMRDALLYQGLKQTDSMMRRIGRFASDALTHPRVPDEKVAEMAQVLRDRTQDLTEAQADFLLAAADDLPVLESRLQTAQTAYERALNEASRIDAQRSMEYQGRMVQWTEGQARKSMTDLEGLLEEAATLGLKVSKEFMGARLPKAALGDNVSLLKAVKSAVTNMTVVQARRGRALTLGRALGTMGEQYARIANAAAEADGLGALSLRRASQPLQDVALARALILGAADRRHFTPTGIKRSLAWMENQLRNVADPARALTGLSNQEANQIFARLLARMAHMRKELVHLADGAKFSDPLQREINVVAAIDNIGEGSSLDVMLRSGYGDDVNPFRSAWEAALPILVGIAKRGESKEYPMLKAIAYAHLPRNLVGPEAGDKVLGQLVKILKGDGVADLTFGEVHARMRAATLEAVGGTTERARSVMAPEVGGERARAAVMAASAVIHAAELARAQARMKQLFGDRFTRAHWRAASQLVEGVGTDDPAAFQGALELLQELGQSPFITQGRRVEGDLDLSWINVGSSEEDAFVPRMWMKHSSEHIGRIVKQHQPYTTSTFSPAMQDIQDGMRKFWQVFNASLVTGVLLPLPKHFVNIFVGNIGQTMLTEGLSESLAFGKAAAVDLAGLGLNLVKLDGIIPHGAKFDAGLDWTRRGVGIDRALPGTTTALMHPVISMIFDPKLGPSTKVIKGARNEVSIGNLRRWALDQGILTSFAQSSGIARAMMRNHVTGFKRAWQMLGAPSRAYASFADTIEQRQRMALFAHLILERGMTPIEAGARVRQALFDWNYPMTRVEAALANNIFIFWGFQRRALAQAMAGVLDPIRDQNNLLRRTLLGSLGAEAQGLNAYQTTRVRDMGSAMAGLRHAFGPASMNAQQDLDGDGDVDADDQSLHSQRAVYPWWAAKPTGSKAFFANLPMSPWTSNAATSRSGMGYTHYAYAIPSLTPLEMTNTLMGMAAAMVAVVRGQEHVGQAVNDYIAPMGGPLGEEFIKVGNSWLTGAEDRGFITPKGVRVKKPTDKTVMYALDSIGRSMGLEPEDTEPVWMNAEEPGMMRVDPKLWAVYKAFTPLSYEVANWYDPAVQATDVASDGKYVQGVAFFMSQLLGLPKAYEHSPADTMAYNYKELSSKVGRAKGQADALPPTLESADPLAVQIAAEAKRAKTTGTDMRLDLSKVKFK